MRLKGEEIVFRAMRPAHLFGKTYRAGDEVVIRLKRDIDLQDPGIFGCGGPWGWGGYTSKAIAALGDYIDEL